MTPTRERWLVPTERLVTAGASLLVVLAIALSGVVSPSPAGAHEQSDFDADDSGGLLDIAAAKQRHQVLYEISTHPRRERRVTEIRLRLLTYEPWETELLSSARNFISFEFDFDGDGLNERCIVISDGRSEPRATLYKHCRYFNDEFVRVLSASRMHQKHGVLVAVDRHRLKKGIRDFKWRAVTSYEDEGNEACLPPDPHEDGGYGTCADFSEWKKHSF